MLKHSLIIFLLLMLPACSAIKKPAGEQVPTREEAPDATALHRMAEKGDAEAQASLGVLYASGRSKWTVSINAIIRRSPLYRPALRGKRVQLQVESKHPMP